MVRVTKRMTNDPRIPIPQDAVIAEVQRQLDKLRAENERLHVAMVTNDETCQPRGTVWPRKDREIERLRAELLTCQETLTACLETT